MKSIADLLREGDPVVADAELPAGDARRMRQLMLAHAGHGSQAGVLWRGVAVLASIVLAAFALGTWLAGAGIGHRNGPGRLAQVDRGAVPEAPPARQVQFVTPRGTRVVWVLQAETPGQEGIR
jgi:hypothetical protein